MKSFIYKEKEYSLHTDIMAINNFCKEMGIKLSQLQEKMFIEDLDAMYVLFKQSIKRWLRYNDRDDDLKEVDFENMFAENYTHIGEYLFNSEFMPKPNGKGKREDVVEKSKKK